MDRLKDLYDLRKLAKNAWREEWNEHMFGWRMTHSDNGKPNHAAARFFTILIFTILIIASVIAGIALIPRTFLVGGTNYHLQNGIDYQCPGGDWHGNTSQMKMVSYYDGRYYYCPLDGRLIGTQSASYSLPGGE